MRKTKEDLVRGWLEKAKRDLFTSKNELETEEPFTDIICYHAQQAAEKSLKGYLIWEGADFPRTHVLEDLVALATQEDLDFAELEGEVSTLTPYAVEVRYPEFKEPLLEDAKEAVKIAKKVRDFVLHKLPEKFQKKFTN